MERQCNVSKTMREGLPRRAGNNTFTSVTRVTTVTREGPPRRAGVGAGRVLRGAQRVPDPGRRRCNRRWSGAAGRLAAGTLDARSCDFDVASGQRHARPRARGDGAETRRGRCASHSTGCGGHGGGCACSDADGAVGGIGAGRGGSACTCVIGEIGIVGCESERSVAQQPAATRRGHV